MNMDFDRCLKKLKIMVDDVLKRNPNVESSISIDKYGKSLSSHYIKIHLKSTNSNAFVDVRYWPACNWWEIKDDRSQSTDFADNFNDLIDRLECYAFFNALNWYNQYHYEVNFMIIVDAGHRIFVEDKDHLLKAIDGLDSTCRPLTVMNMMTG